MRIRAAMQQKLTDALAPSQLVIEDNSHRHAGHGGHHPDGESHFHITVVSQAFAGKSRVERHRMVNAIVAQELAERVHALQLTTKTPDEA